MKEIGELIRQYLSYIKEELKVLKEELSSGKKTYKTISLKKVHILSTAYTVAVISAISSCIIVMLMSPFIVGFAAFLPPEAGRILTGSFIILLLIIVILYFIMGFIVGAIYAVSYNIVASITGGLKGDVDIDKRDH